MVLPSEFTRRRPPIRLRDGENSFTLKDPYPVTAFEREQLRHLLLIPTHFPIVAAVGVSSIYVDGHTSAPRAITLMEESVIFLNRLSVRKQSPWLWAYGPALCHEIAHLQGYVEHGMDMDAASYAIWNQMVDVLDL